MSGRVTPIPAGSLLESFTAFNPQFDTELKEHPTACAKKTSDILTEIREYLLAVLKNSDLSIDPALEEPFQAFSKNLVVACQSLRPGCPEFFIFHDSKPFMQILLATFFSSDGKDSTEALEILRIFLETHHYHQETSADHHPGTVDLSRLSELFSRICHEGEFKKLNFIFEPHIDALKEVPTGNRALLWTAIYNLVSNAAKYGQRNSDGQYEIRISVSATLDGKSVITVSNRGMLPEPMVSNFISAFSRIHTLTASTSADGASSGRALQELINLGAQFNVSQKDGLVSFSFQVSPYTPAPSESPGFGAASISNTPLSSAMTAPDTSATLHILVVDDANKRILTERTLPGLQASGHRLVISTAESYEDPSVAKWQEATGKKLLLADHNIDGGGQSGLEFVQALRIAGDNTPVIFIAGNSMDDYLGGQALPDHCYDNESKMLTLSGKENLVLKFLFAELGIDFTWTPAARRPASSPATPFATSSATLTSALTLGVSTSPTAGSRDPSPPALLSDSNGFSIASLVVYSASAGAGSNAMAPQ